MKKSFFALLAVLVLAALVLTACGGQPSGGSTSSRPTPPAQYASKTNPVKGNATAIAEGKKSYDIYCTTCHGPKGAGDGPAGAALSPKPGNLMKAGAEASDAYLFWRVEEGGGFAPFNSSMPSQKATLSEDKVWQILAYIQNGFK